MSVFSICSLLFLQLLICVPGCSDCQIMCHEAESVVTVLWSIGKPWPLMIGKCCQLEILLILWSVFQEYFKYMVCMVCVFN